MKWELLQLDTTLLVSTICLLDNTVFDQIPRALCLPFVSWTTLYLTRSPGPWNGLGKRLR